MAELTKRLARALLSPKVIHREKLVVVDDADRCTKPVFLIGLHRSGTTLVRQIVDAHPNIACPPESFFLLDLARNLSDKHFYSGLEQLGFDRDGVDAALARFAGQFFEAYRRSKTKPRWADKTPSYGIILPFIDRLFGPGCRYVMIYRHPLDVIASLLQRGWSFGDYSEDPFENTLQFVQDHLAKQLEHERAHADRCFRLHYEKLTREPEPLLRDMFAFLGEPWDDRVLRYWQQPHDYGKGDEDAQRLKGFKAAEPRWHDWPDDQVQRAVQTLGPQLDQLNYPTDKHTHY